GRLTRANLSFGMNFNSKNKKDDAKKPNIPEGGESPGDNDEPAKPAGPDIFDNYVDFTMPWTFGFDYSFNYGGPTKAFPKGKITQTLGLRGNISITPQWKMNMNTNF